MDIYKNLKNELNNAIYTHEENIKKFDEVQEFQIYKLKKEITIQKTKAKKQQPKKDKQQQRKLQNKKTKQIKIKKYEEKHKNDKIELYLSIIPPTYPEIHDKIIPNQLKEIRAKFGSQNMIKHAEEKMIETFWFNDIEKFDDIIKK